MLHSLVTHCHEDGHLTCLLVLTESQVVTEVRLNSVAWLCQVEYAVRKVGLICRFIQ